MQIFLWPALSDALRTFTLILLAVPTSFCRSYTFAKVNVLSLL